MTQSWIVIALVAALVLSLDWQMGGHSVCLRDGTIAIRTTIEKIMFAMRFCEAACLAGLGLQVMPVFADLARFVMCGRGDRDHWAIMGVAMMVIAVMTWMAVSYAAYCATQKRQRKMLKAAINAARSADCSGDDRPYVVTVRSSDLVAMLKNEGWTLRRPSASIIAQEKVQEKERAEKRVMKSEIIQRPAGALNPCRYER